MDVTSAGAAGSIRRGHRDSWPVTGYSLLLPGWWRLPLSHGTSDAIAGIAGYWSSLAAAGGPGLMTPGALRQQLAGLAQQARAAGVLELYLPLGPAPGAAIPASIAVARGPAPLDGLATWRLLAPQMPGGEQVRPVTVDGAKGVRIEQPPAAPGAAGPAHHVEYVLPLPGASGDWLIVTCTSLAVPVAGGAGGGQLAALFDAIMSTFRWER